ncbi:MAG: hypothetical protein NTV87_12675 [Ignavibacteriae bacterium]|nr:hypothetical protein [Ignavibacteriota bacterium]
MALDDYLSNNDERQNLENRKPPMPDKLTSLLKKCFQQEPSDRPENMKTIENELTSIYCQITGRDYTRKKIQEIELKADELNNRAISYLDLGREDKAIECWKDALKADVHHLESTFNYGYFRWQKADITDDDMVKQMEVIKFIHYKNPDYWLLLGWIHYERGDVVEIDKIQKSVNRITDEKFLKALKDRDRPIGKEVRKIERFTENDSSVCISQDGMYALSSSGGYLIPSAYGMSNPAKKSESLRSKLVG